MRSPQLPGWASVCQCQLSIKFPKLKRPLDCEQMADLRLKNGEALGTREQSSSTILFSLYFANCYLHALKFSQIFGGSFHHAIWHGKNPEIDLSTIHLSIYLSTYLSIYLCTAGWRMSAPAARSWRSGSSRRWTWSPSTHPSSRGPASTAT